jgi:hypothetical protein
MGYTSLDESTTRTACVPSAAMLISAFAFVMKGDYEESTRQRTSTCTLGDIVVKTAGVRHLNRFGQQGAVCLLLEISEEFLEDSTGTIEYSHNSS